MADALSILLDQNVPREVADWLRVERPAWKVLHTSDIGLSAASDREIFLWAQKEGAVVVTFDEDFADVRFLPGGRHAGVVRLRVWPTTVEETENALGRLLGSVPDCDLPGALIIIDRHRIRIRRRRPALGEPVEP